MQNKKLVKKKKKKNKYLILAHCHSNLRQINIHHSWLRGGFYWEAEGADTFSKQIYFQIHTDFNTYLATRWIFLLH